MDSQLLLLLVSAGILLVVALVQTRREGQISKARRLHRRLPVR